MFPGHLHQYMSLCMTLLGSQPFDGARQNQFRNGCNISPARDQKNGTASSVQALFLTTISHHLTPASQNRTQSPASDSRSRPLQSRRTSFLQDQQYRKQVRSSLIAPNNSRSQTRASALHGRAQPWCLSLLELRLHSKPSRCRVPSPLSTRSQASARLQDFSLAASHPADMSVSLALPKLLPAPRSHPARLATLSLLRSLQSIWTATCLRRAKESLRFCFPRASGIRICQWPPPLLSDILEGQQDHQPRPS